MINFVSDSSKKNVRRTYGFIQVAILPLVLLAMSVTTFIVVSMIGKSQQDIRGRAAGPYCKGTSNHKSNCPSYCTGLDEDMCYLYSYCGCSWTIPTTAPTNAPTKVPTKVPTKAPGTQCENAAGQCVPEAQICHPPDQLNWADDCGGGKKCVNEAAYCAYATPIPPTNTPTRVPTATVIRTPTPTRTPTLIPTRYQGYACEEAAGKCVSNTLVCTNPGDFSRFNDCASGKKCVSEMSACKTPTPKPPTPIPTRTKTPTPIRTPTIIPTRYQGYACVEAAGKCVSTTLVCTNPGDFSRFNDCGSGKKCVSEISACKTPTPKPPTRTPTPTIRTTPGACAGTCYPNSEICANRSTASCGFGKYCCLDGGGTPVPTITPKPSATPTPAQSSLAYCVDYCEEYGGGYLDVICLAKCVLPRPNTTPRTTPSPTVTPRVTRTPTPHLRSDAECIDLCDVGGFANLDCMDICRSGSPVPTRYPTATRSPSRTPTPSLAPTRAPTLRPSPTKIPGRSSAYCIEMCNDGNRVFADCYDPCIAGTPIPTLYPTATRSPSRTPTPTSTPTPTTICRPLGATGVRSSDTCCSPGVRIQIGGGMSGSFACVTPTLNPSQCIANCIASGKTASVCTSSCGIQTQTLTPIPTKFPNYYPCSNGTQCQSGRCARDEDNTMACFPSLSPTPTCLTGQSSGYTSNECTSRRGTYKNGCCTLPTPTLIPTVAYANCLDRCNSIRNTREQTFCRQDCNRYRPSPTVSTTLAIGAVCYGPGLQVNICNRCPAPNVTDVVNPGTSFASQVCRNPNITPTVRPTHTQTSPSPTLIPTPIPTVPFCLVRLFGICLGPGYTGVGQGAGVGPYTLPPTLTPTMTPVPTAACVSGAGAWCGMGTSGKCCDPYSCSNYICKLDSCKNAVECRNSCTNGRFFTERNAEGRTEYYCGVHPTPIPPSSTPVGPLAIGAVCYGPGLQNICSHCPSPDAVNVLNAGSAYATMVCRDPSITPTVGPTHPVTPTPIPEGMLADGAECNLGFLGIGNTCRNCVSGTSHVVTRTIGRSVQSHRYCGPEPTPRPTPTPIPDYASGASCPGPTECTSRCPSGYFTTRRDGRNTYYYCADFSATVRTLNPGDTCEMQSGSPISCTYCLNSYVTTFNIQTRLPEYHCRTTIPITTTAPVRTPTTGASGASTESDCVGNSDCTPPLVCVSHMVNGIVESQTCGTPTPTPSVRPTVTVPSTPRPTPTPRPASEGTCAGGVPINQCAKSNTNNWVRCTAGTNQGNTSGRYPYPYYAEDESCAIFSITLADGSSLEVNLETEGEDRPNLAACLNVATQNLGTCDGGIPYGYCSVDKKYVCDCDPNHDYRYPTYRLKTSGETCPDNAPLFYTPAIQGAIDRQAELAQARQASCSQGCARGTNIYSVGACMTTSGNAPLICACDDSTNWVPTAKATVGERCWNAVPSSIGNQYVAASGYLCGDDGNVYRSGDNGTQLVQWCRNQGLICQMRGSGTIQCMGATSVEELQTAGLGGSSDTYACSSQNGYARRDGSGSRICPSGTRCCSATSTDAGCKDGNGRSLVADGVVQCVATSSTWERFVDNYTRRIEEMQADELAAYQAAYQCDGGVDYAGTRQKTGGGSEICICDITTSTPPSIVPNTCRWETRASCGTYSAGESWIDGEYCSFCGVTGVIGREPLYSTTSFGTIPSSNCMRYFDTRVDTASGRAVYTLKTENTAIDASGNEHSPGIPYCGQQTTSSGTRSVTTTQCVYSLVDVNGTLQTYPVDDTDITRALRCPAACALFGAGSNGAGSTATGYIKRCSADGSSVVYDVTETDELSGYEVITSTVVDKVCSTGLCQNGRCVDGVTYYDSHGTLRFCNTGETCAMLDPITGSVVNTRVTAITDDDGTVTYNRDMVWGGTQHQAQVAEMNYMREYNANIDEYILQNYTQTYLDAFFEYRQDHPTAQLEEFQAVQAKALVELGSAIQNNFNTPEQYQEYMDKVERGEIIPTQALAAYKEVTNFWEHPIIATVNGFNQLTSGATKRGNEIAMQGYEQMAEGDTFLEDLAGFSTLARGAIIQGAAPAAVVVLIAAIPALPVAGLLATGSLAGATAFTVAGLTTGAGAMAFGGTALGVAGTTYSLQNTAEACVKDTPMTDQEKLACGFAVGNTVFAAVSTGVGVVASQAQLARALTQVATRATTVTSMAARAEIAVNATRLATLNAPQTVQILNRGVSALGTFVFGGQAVYECAGLVTGREGSSGINCASMTAMALVSAARWGTANSQIQSTQRIVGTSDVLVNIGTAIPSCLSMFQPGTADYFGCFQNFAGAILQTGGEIQGLRDNTNTRYQDTDTAKLNDAITTRAGFYDEQGNLRLGITSDQVREIDTSITSIITRIGQNEAYITMSERILGGDTLSPSGRNLQWLIDEYNKLPEFRVNETADTAILRQDLLQQIKDTYYFVQGENALQTSPAHTIGQTIEDVLIRVTGNGSEEVLAYVGARDAYNAAIHDVNVSPQQYEDTLTTLKNTRQALENVRATEAQAQIRTTIEQTTTRIEELQTRAQDIQDDITAIQRSDPNVIQEIGNQLSQIKTELADAQALRTALGIGEATIDVNGRIHINGKYASSDISSLIGDTYHYGSDPANPSENIWRRVGGDGNPTGDAVDVSVVTSELNSRIQASRSEIDTTITQLTTQQDRVTQVTKDVESYQLAKSTNDTTAQEQILQSYRSELASVTQDFHSAQTDIQVLSRQYDAAGSLGNRIRETFSLDPSIPTREALLGPGQAKTVVTDTIEKKPTLGERISTALFGTEDQPSTLWKRIEQADVFGLASRFGITDVAGNPRTWTTLSEQYSDTVTTRGVEQTKPRGVDYRSEVTRIAFDKGGSINAIGEWDVTTRLTSLDDVVGTLRSNNAEDGRYTFKLTDASGKPFSVDLLYSGGKLYFDSQTKTNAGGVVEVPDNMFITRTRLYETGSSPLTAAQRQLIDKINTTLGKFEERAFTPRDAAGNPLNQGAIRKGIESGRGIESGVKDASRIIIDALIGRNPQERGILFEGVTGLGKTMTVLPELAYMKASLTGENVMTLMNTKGDLYSSIKNYVDIDTLIGREVKSFADMTIEEIRLVEARLTEIYDGQKVLIFDGEPTHARSPQEIAEARHLFTTKDIIFESLRRGNAASDAIMQRRGILLADEGQLSLDLAIDYIMSAGGQVKLSANDTGRQFTDMFRKVIEGESSLVRTAMEQLKNGDLQGARDTLSVVRDGQQGRISNDDTLNTVYRQLFENSIDPAYRTKIQPLVDAIFNDPGKVVENLQRFMDGYDVVSLPDDAKALLSGVRDGFASRKTAMESIVNQLSRTPGNDIRVGTEGDAGGRAILAENNAPSGRSPSMMFDALALEFVGAHMLMADNPSLRVTVSYDMVSVSSQSKGTNYAQFLKNYSEIYAFTGTPKYVAETFDIVYGIRMGASDINQADLVFGNGENPGAHPIRTIQQSKDFQALNSSLAELRTKRLAGGNVESIVIATAKESTNSFLRTIYESRNTDILLRRSTGDAVVLRMGADGQFTELTRLADAKAVDAKLAEYRAGNTNITQVYEYGAHYGTDVTTYANETFTVIVGEDTTMTDFLQSVGRDRCNFGCSGLDVVALGDMRINNQTVDNADTLRAFLDSKENVYIQDKIFNAIKRVQENIPLDAIARMRAEALRGVASGSKEATEIYAYFDKLEMTYRQTTELNMNVGHGMRQAQTEVIDAINRGNTYLRNIDLSDLPESVRNRVQRVLSDTLSGTKPTYTIADLTSRITDFTNNETARRNASKPLNEAQNYNESLDALAALITDPVRNTDPVKYTSIQNVLVREIPSGGIHPEVSIQNSDISNQAHTASRGNATLDDSGLTVPADLSTPELRQTEVIRTNGGISTRRITQFRSKNCSYKCCGSP